MSEYDRFCGALYDEDANLEFDSSWAYQRDGLGRSVLVEGDEGIDGTVDRRIYSVYGEYGLEEERQVDAEERMLRLVRNTYDENGNAIEQVGQVAGGTGWQLTGAYDELNRLVQLDYDEEMDGRADRFTLYTYDADEGHRGRTFHLSILCG